MNWCRISQPLPSTVCCINNSSPTTIYCWLGHPWPRKLSKLCNSGSKGVFAPWLRLDPVALCRHSCAIAIIGWSEMWDTLKHSAYAVFVAPNMSASKRAPYAVLPVDHVSFWTWKEWILGAWRFCKIPEKDNLQTAQTHHIAAHRSFRIRVARCTVPRSITFTGAGEPRSAALSTRSWPSMRCAATRSPVRLLSWCQ